jgi:hypothetical protein
MLRRRWATVRVNALISVNPFCLSNFQRSSHCRAIQHLRMKHFYGTSENAVKTQIWIAVSAYVLVAIIKKELALEISLYTFLQILSGRPFRENSDFKRLP